MTFVALATLLASSCSPNPRQPVGDGAAADSWLSCEAFSRNVACAQGDFVDVVSSATPYLITASDSGYKPRCMRARASFITFFGAVTDHPPVFACGVAPPAKNKVGVGYHLLLPGLYGYYCSVHGDTTGRGHAGLIEITDRQP